MLQFLIILSNKKLKQLRAVCLPQALWDRDEGTKVAGAACVAIRRARVTKWQIGFVLRAQSVTDLLLALRRRRRLILGVK